MAKYIVKVTEENYGNVIIKADSPEEACDKIYDAYEAGEIFWHNTSLTHISAELEEESPGSDECCHYEIRNEDGYLLDYCYNALESVIEYAVEHGGYAIYRAEDTSAEELVWERSVCEWCRYYGQCIDPTKRVVKGVELCEDYKLKEG